MKLGHWRAGHWIGREHADDYEVDGDEHGGLVAKTGRWFSDAWWDGHWLKRTRCGQWRDTTGGVEVCHRRTSHDGEHAYSRPSLARARAAAVPDDLLYPSGNSSARRRLDERSRGAGDYRAYRANGPTLQAREFHAQAAGGGGQRGLYAIAGVPY